MDRKPCGRDLTLSGAMALAMVLLAGLYLVTLAIPLWLNSIGFLPLHYALGADAFVLLLLGLQYASLDAAALRASRARIVDAGDAPRLHAAVVRLCGLADLPKPRLAVVDTAVPDAFAAGGNPSRSTIAITRGLVEALEPEEIEAVLAHELAHVANRDGAVMTIASFPALTLGEAIREAPARVWIFLFPLMLLACVAYAISLGLMLTVSRCREYAADRGSALITGAPEQLMSALQKIAGRMPEIPRQDLRGVASMSALFIVPTSLRSLTHPPLEKRLARLAELAREAGEPAAPVTASARRVNLLLGAGAFLVVFTAIVLAGTALR